MQPVTANNASSSSRPVPSPVKQAVPTEHSVGAFFKYNRAVPKLSRFAQLLIAVLLLLVFAAQVTLASPANSAAFDEEYHLATGYAYLKTGDPRLNTEHPPLINWLNALPLLFLDPKLPLDSPAWVEAHTVDFGDEFLWQTNVEHAIPIVLLGRLPILFLGLLLGTVIYRWTRDLFGNTAAMLALTLFAFDPNLIANAGVSTTDLGLATTLTLALWRLWVWLEKPTRRNLVIVGVAAGLALTAKYTGVMVVPLFALVALIYPMRSVETTRGWFRTISARYLKLILAGLIALLVVWAVHSFEIKDGLPAATYWRGLIKVFTEYSQGRPTYLFGQITRMGAWTYFPVAFAIKTPLPTLLLFVVGSGLIFTRRRARRSAAAWLPPLILMAFALISPLAIGYRHILPVLPFVIIVAGQAANLQLSMINDHWRRALQIAWAMLIGYLVIDTLSIYPHHLSYFNALAGGPLQADRVLVDSNLDWGQDLPALQDVLARRNLACVNLSYFGTALPASYGVRYSPLPAFPHFTVGPEMDAFNPYTPEPGMYALSVTSLRMGLVWSNPDLYAYFLDKQPIDRAGYSIRLYEVSYPPETPITRAVISSIPTYDVPPETLGVEPHNRVNVKWIDGADAFILPMNGPARFLTPDWLSFDPALSDELKAVGQRDGEAVIVDARPIVAAKLAEWQAAPQAQLPDRTVLNWPVQFGDKLALIGYRVSTSARQINAVTYWRVTGQLDGCESLAYFMHVTGAEPSAIIGQHDGWNVAQRGLEVGDVIVEHARIALPKDTAPGEYQLRVGLYSPDTGQRLTVTAPNGSTADHVLLSPIEIKTP